MVSAGSPEMESKGDGFLLDAKEIEDVGGGGEDMKIVLKTTEKEMSA